MDVTNTTINITDDFVVGDYQTGVETVWCTIYGINSSGGFSVFDEINSPTLTQGNKSEGSYNCTFTISGNGLGSFQPGNWKYRIWAWDYSNNVKVEEVFFELVSTASTTTTTTTASCVGITFPAPPDNELYIFGTLDVSNCQVLTTGFQCAQNCVGLVNQTAGGKTQAYFWAENNSATWLSNWSGYYQPSSGKFYVTSSGQGGGFEFTPPYQGP